MEKPDKLNDLFKGRIIVKNTIYNLLGYGIPLLFALIIIPVLLTGLGTERFGILNIVWMVIGYFSFFDFGIGKGLTRIVAVKISRHQMEDIPRLFWTSLFLMFNISLICAAILFFLVPYLASIFKISNSYLEESKNIFYLLAISIPIVSTTAGLRGVLEAYQKFGIINIMRIILGISTFIGPFFVLLISKSLYWIVVVLIIIRVIIWILYLLQCFKINNEIVKYIKLDFSSIKPILVFSSWITLANIIGPLILYSDRFLIGSLISATALTYYATPYEIITKLLLIPGALTGVLFPVFSSSFSITPDLSKKILLRGLKFIFLILYTPVFLVIAFSYEGMNLWLGENFANNSSLVLQFLSIGILMNSISSIPNNFFQGVGRPKIPTIINLIELPIYLLVMVLSIKQWGLKGASFIYMSMASIDAIVMCLAAKKLYNVRFETEFNFIPFISLLLILIIPFFIEILFIKIIFTVGVLFVFFVMSWRYFLSPEEKYFLISKIKYRFN